MFDVSQTHADPSLWEGLKTLDFSAFYQLLFSLEGFPGGSDSIESDCNTGEITMKNGVTNLALLRGGSPEPRALCGPVFVCLVLEPCLLVCLASLDTSSPGEPSTWPSRHQAPQGPDFSPPRSSNPRAWWPCYQVSGFRSHATLSRKTFWLSLVSQEELASCSRCPSSRWLAFIPQDTLCRCHTPAGPQALRAGRAWVSLLLGAAIPAQDLEKVCSVKAIKEINSHFIANVMLSCDSPCV